MFVLDFLFTQILADSNIYTDVEYFTQVSMLVLHKLTCITEIDASFMLHQHKSHLPPSECMTAGGGGSRSVWETTPVKGKGGENASSSLRQRT